MYVVKKQKLKLSEDLEEGIGFKAKIPSVEEVWVLKAYNIL